MNLQQKSSAIPARPYMAMSLLPLVLLISHLGAAYSSNNDQFAYDGFAGASLDLDGAARVARNGLLEVTNGTAAMTGHALHTVPLRFHETPNNGTARVRSFSTAFVFAIVSPHLHLSSHGMALFVSPTRDFSTAMSFQYLGLLNATDASSSRSNGRIIAVELDTVLNYELGDIDNNHVGIDVDSLKSVAAASAGYYDDELDSPAHFRNVSLFSGESMQVWVDYDGRAMELHVTLAPSGTRKPNKPLLSHAIDLSTVVPGEAYIGFSASTGLLPCSHYVLGWSFSFGEATPTLDVSRLPSFPRPTISKPRSRKALAIVLAAVAAMVMAVITVAVVLVFVRRRMEYAELHEDWEAEFEARRFSYKKLFDATDGFSDKRLVGKGGCGEVYRGVLSRCKTEVAVKRVFNESRRGAKEFVAEVASMGRIKHRNLVQLLGYCRRRKGDEFFLVYEYMPNGSLDKNLHQHDDDHHQVPLRWDQRFRIIKGIASGLFHLHEEGAQVVVHRDIKASNVLLDGEMNGRLGDFGLARPCGCVGAKSSGTTGVVGTTGYLAPELLRTGEAGTATDVFAYGAFLLEVVCGQRPVELTATGETFVLVEYVLRHWHGGSLTQAADARLEGEYDAEELCLALELGLLCSHPLASARPSMRQVVQYLHGGALLPELMPMHLSGHAIRAAAQPTVWPAHDTDKFI